MAYSKINYVLVLLFVLSVISTSCKRMSKEYTTVEISIINPADGTPFVGVPVKLLEEESKNSGITSELFMEDKTNNNGIVKFEFKAAKTSKYWYNPIIDEDYFGEYSTWEYLKRPSPSSYIIKKDQDNLIEYEITYYAYLKKIIKNINCEGENDTIFIHEWSVPSYGSRAYDYEHSRPGCVDYNPNSSPGDWPPGYGLVHMGGHYFKWEVHRDGEITFGSDSLYLEKDELGVVEIIY